NNAADRPYQDVGFDGLDDDSEKVKFNTYVANIDATQPLTSTLRKMVDTDPSKDDYVWYRDATYDANGTGILGRYKYYSNSQGNSPIAGTSSYSPAATLYPDNEDLNRDNTLNEVESYFEYNIDLQKGMVPSSNNYITDKRTVHVTYANKTTGTEDWYLFRVPIRKPTSSYGNIQDFKSIRFMRMYLTGFDDSVVLRFASLNLVRDQWRQFTYQIDSTGNYDPPKNPNTTFNVLAVNLEENSNRTPVKYAIPCGIDRVQMQSTNGVNLLQNEQSMSLQVKDLDTMDARGVIKTVSLDMRSYGKLSMFAHVENMIGSLNTIQNRDVSLVMRIGQDYLTNYYEIKVPMQVTPAGASDCATIWPDSNSIDFNLQDLIQLKLRRNNKQSFSKVYREQIGNKTFSVMGNPNIGQVNGIMIAIQNNKNAKIDAEVWVDELRLSEINETGSYAALGKVDLTLADLGRITVSGNMYSQGWGTIDSKINERAKDNMTQFDAALNIDAGKLLPKAARLSIPVYASITNTVHTPQFDPYDLDVKYEDKISAAKTQAMKDSIKNVAQDKTTIKTINLTNVKVLPKGKPHLWSLSNLDFTLSYTQTVQTSPVILNNDIQKWRGGFGYTYNRSSKYIEPLKKLIKSKSKWVSLIKDVNFNLTPSLLSFRTDINRQYAVYIPRIVNTDLTQTSVTKVDTTFDKFFTFDRFYNLRWDLTRAINLDYSAINNARVDEPYGALDTKAKKDTVRENFFKGGRTTMFQQKANASYTFPLSKLPITDWITARYTYGTSYNWMAASLVNIELGNTIENSQSNVINTEFDFSRLYLKSRWLKALNKGSATSNANLQQNKPGNDKGIKGGKNEKGGNVKGGKGDNLNNIAPVNNTATVTIPEVPSKADFVGDLTGPKRDAAIKKWKKMKKDRRIALRLQRQNTPVEMNGFVRAAGNV
ncbi:MAG: cell surface protein SprA, partial [Bacteroidota bacterium]